MKDRLISIKEVVDKAGKVTLIELQKAFPSISSMTIRRDLKKLEENNQILRIPGGAISVESVLRESEKDFSERISFNASEKLEISEKAVKIIESKSCVFIDGGSTTTYFARALKDDNFYIITNSMTIAETIARKEKPTVTFLGGDLKKNTFITVGKTCLDLLDKINVEFAVMTATGFIKDTCAFTCGSQSEAEVKRRVIEKADKVIMLLDSSKVNKKTPYTFSYINDVDCLVVDKKFPKEIINVVQNKGIKVI